jgi:uncharacterized protein YjbI with pentapeptide repeats
MGLCEANLSKSHLSAANLSEAHVNDEQLVRGKSLKGATMPDGKLHDWGERNAYNQSDRRLGDRGMVRRR